MIIPIKFKRKFESSSIFKYRVSEHKRNIFLNSILYKKKK